MTKITCVDQVVHLLAAANDAPLTSAEIEFARCDCAANIPPAAIADRIRETREWQNVRRALPKLVPGKMLETDWLAAYQAFLKQDADLSAIAEAVKASRLVDDNSGLDKSVPPI